MFVGFLAVMIHSIRSLSPESDEASEEDSEEDSDDDAGLQDTTTVKLGLMTVGGLIGLLIGSNMLVEGASSIALTMGVPETVVGITMVAFGTSVPDWLHPLPVGKRGKHAMLLGGVIGSNSANLAIIFGLGFLFNTRGSHTSIRHARVPYHGGLYHGTVDLHAQRTNQ